MKELSCVLRRWLRGLVSGKFCVPSYCRDWLQSLKEVVFMLLQAHENIEERYLNLSPFGLNICYLSVQQRGWYIFGECDCPMLCIVLVKQLKTSKRRVTAKQTGIIPCTVKHTGVSSGLKHKHAAIMCTLPHFHKSYMTPHKRDNGKKRLSFFFSSPIFQTVTLAVWGMHGRENTCLMSVRTGSLQTCWHTFMDTGRLCGMEHTWSAQLDLHTHTHTITWTLSPKNPV